MYMTSTAEWMLLLLPNLRMGKWMGQLGKIQIIPNTFSWIICVIFAVVAVIVCVCVCVCVFEKTNTLMTFNYANTNIFCFITVVAKCMATILCPVITLIFSRLNYLFDQLQMWNSLTWDCILFCLLYCNTFYSVYTLCTVVGKRWQCLLFVFSFVCNKTIFLLF